MWHNIIGCLPWYVSVLLCSKFYLPCHHFIFLWNWNIYSLPLYSGNEQFSLWFYGGSQLRDCYGFQRGLWAFASIITVKIMLYFVLWNDFELWGSGVECYDLNFQCPPQICSLNTLSLVCSIYFWSQSAGRVFAYLKVWISGGYIYLQLPVSWSTSCEQEAAGAFHWLRLSSVLPSFKVKNRTTKSVFPFISYSCLMI